MILSIACSSPTLFGDVFVTGVLSNRTNISLKDTISFWVRKIRVSTINKYNNFDIVFMDTLYSLIDCILRDGHVITKIVTEYHSPQYLSNYFSDVIRKDFSNMNRVRLYLSPFCKELSLRLASRISDEYSSRNIMETIAKLNDRDNFPNLTKLNDEDCLELWLKENREELIKSIYYDYINRDIIDKKFTELTDEFFEDPIEFFYLDSDGIVDTLEHTPFEDADSVIKELYGDGDHENI